MKQLGFIRLSKHITAVVNGVIHDTYDPSRGGSRCVYGVWYSCDYTREVEGFYHDSKRREL